MALVTLAAAGGASVVAGPPSAWAAKSPRRSAAAGTDVTTATALSSTSTTTPSPSPAPAGEGAASESAPVCSAGALSEARQVVESALTGRVSQLDLLVSRVDGASALAQADKAALLDDLTQRELPGIQGLQSTVQSAGTCNQIRQDAHQMVFDYRVYLLMTPQTDLVIATDIAADVAAKLAALEPALTSRIADAEGQGADVAGAEAAAGEYEARVSASQSLLAGQSSTLLGLTPSGYPDNAGTLHQARANLQTVRSDLQAARSDVEQIRQDLS